MNIRPLSTDCESESCLLDYSFESLADELNMSTSDHQYDFIVVDLENIQTVADNFGIIFNENLCKAQKYFFNVANFNWEVFEQDERLINYV